MKICSKCKRELPLTEFNKDKKTSDGFRCWCKDCGATYIKKYNKKNKNKKKEKSSEYYQNNVEGIKKKTSEYYYLNREKLLKKNKERKEKNKGALKQDGKIYYTKNKEKINQYKKEWYQKNRKEILKKAKVYYDGHKEKIAEYNKNWRKNNPDKKRESDKNWRKNNPEKVANRIRRVTAKRRRELGYFELWSNPFPNEIKVDFHHVNNLIVVPLPHITHNKMSYPIREVHRIKCNVWVERIYMLDLDKLLSDK